MKSRLDYGVDMWYDSDCLKGGAMDLYFIPILLYLIAIAFGVFWIWVCGGFEKHEVRWRKHFIVHKSRSIGWTELSVNVKFVEVGGNLYEGSKKDKNRKGKINEKES